MFTPQAEEAIRAFLGYKTATANVPLETLKEKAGKIREFLDTHPDLFASAKGDDRAVAWIEQNMYTASAGDLKRALLQTAIAHAECLGEEPVTQIEIIEALCRTF